MFSKAERVSKVIIAAGKWNPPVIIGLCEVENLQVLEILVGMETLKKYQYKIIQKDSPDRRGIDVALIYRPDYFVPFEYRAVEVKDPENPNFRTRDILRVSGIFNNCDTLHVFVNHWPSRYGGIMETIKYRKLAAEVLKRSVLELCDQFENPKIVCMGDFNDSPMDESIARSLSVKNADDPETQGELISLSSKWANNLVQTIKSGYSWQVFDQFIVSDYFLAKNDCFDFLTAEIFKAGFLLEPDIKFGGMKPKRTYVGYKYQEGFSDHLPILLHILNLNH
jgi:hypothetical protein